MKNINVIKVLTLNIQKAMNFCSALRAANESETWLGLRLRLRFGLWIQSAF